MTNPPKPPVAGRSSVKLDSVTQDAEVKVEPHHEANQKREFAETSAGLEGFAQAVRTGQVGGGRRGGARGLFVGPDAAV
jgi:hypothetical protein